MKTRRFRKAVDQTPAPEPLVPAVSSGKETLSDVMADLRDMMRSIEIVPDEPGKTMVGRRSRLDL